MENLSLERIAVLPLDHLHQLLFGENSTQKSLALHGLATLWKKKEADAGTLISCLSAIFGKLDQIDVNSPPWMNPLFKIKRPTYKLDGGQRPLGFLVWYQEKVESSYKDLHCIITEVIANLKKEEANSKGSKDGESRWKPLLILTGPGTAAALLDSQRKLSILKGKDFLRAAWKPDMTMEIIRRARLQHSLLHRSPFQITSALPPNSPVFFGRLEEMEFIKARINQGSILIVGSRKVGKTSLLHQVSHWALKQDDLLPIYLDLQGVEKDEGFYTLLNLELPKRGLKHWIGKSIRALADIVQEQGKTLVFLLNEIDEMVKLDSQFVSAWRSLNDAKKARFVMVGYNTLNLVGSPDSPFFHFTQGTAYDNKALPLRQLTPEAALEIPKMLTSSELQLRWFDKEEEKAAHTLLLDRSYRIPWVLQTYCHKLVEGLNEERSDVLTYKRVADLVKADKESPVVWEYINGIEYERLEDRRDNRFPLAFKLILYTLVRDRYLLGGVNAHIRDKQLAAKDAFEPPFSFSVGEAFGVIEETLQLILFKEEHKPVKEYFREFDLNKALRLLTLTLLVEPHPIETKRYGFLLHILPNELHRHFQHEDPTLDNEILKLSVELLTYFQR